MSEAKLEFKLTTTTRVLKFNEGEEEPFEVIENTKVLSDEEAKELLSNMEEGVRNALIKQR